MKFRVVSVWASGEGGENGGAALAEADAGMVGGFAGAAQDDLVAVL